MAKRAAFALFLWSMLALHTAAIQVAVEGENEKVHTSIPLIKIESERLPDLNIPRVSHQLLVVNGEYIVVGGHSREQNVPS